jgi:hypothetical protein
VLKVAFVSYLHDTKPEMLECKVERFLHDKDSSIYCPNLLHPIKLFWAAGNHYVGTPFSWVGQRKNGE